MYDDSRVCLKNVFSHIYFYSEKNSCLRRSVTVYEMRQILHGKVKNAGGILDMWKLDICPIFKIVENNKIDHKKRKCGKLIQNIVINI